MKKRIRASSESLYKDFYVLYKNAKNLYKFHQKPEEISVYISGHVAGWLHMFYYSLQNNDTKKGTLMSISMPWKMATGIISLPE